MQTVESEAPRLLASIAYEWRGEAKMAEEGVAAEYGWWSGFRFAGDVTRTDPDTSVDNIFRDTQGCALPLVVQRDIQLIRQAWADKGEQAQEQEFTTVVSKQRKKKNNRLANNADQHYQTRSKGAPPV
ncbi:hypothetical protein L195_g021292 [Trifolium pratense]|uniref:Uncharacterized protein n=1 Tax=Trifolium pratense TaxID=57577 RepID=A0A2K3N4V1_TRIPR|nr:hypothetical protein L195_g021292 [Trifolium pratense]